MTKHDTLPLPDFDHLPLGSVQSRIRPLDAEAVQTLLEYERAHAHRLPVIQVLEHRLAELRRGAEPSDGDPAPDVVPEAPAPPGDRSKVSEATSGPKINPPSHGDPTNPAQPRSGR